MEPKYLTPKKLAELLDTTPGALANMRWRGEGPPFIKVSKKKILYNLSEVERYLERHTIKTDKVNSRTRKQIEGGTPME